MLLNCLQEENPYMALTQEEITQSERHIKSIPDSRRKYRYVYKFPKTWRSSGIWFWRRSQSGGHFAATTGPARNLKQQQPLVPWPVSLKRAARSNKPTQTSQSTAGLVLGNNTKKYVHGKYATPDCAIETLGHLSLIYYEICFIDIV